MSILSLKTQIENYKPYNEQEEHDKQLMLSYIDSFDDVLTRENKNCHFTSSAWAVNKDRTKVLMIYHKIYNSWAWTGGHADGESDLLQTAIRELKEETSVQNVKVVDDDIFSLEVVCVNGHEKRGEYVSSHLHLNLTYLLEVDENEELKLKEDENSGVKWIPVEEIKDEVNEAWVLARIYNKEIEKLNRYKN